MRDTAHVERNRPLFELMALGELTLRVNMRKTMESFNNAEHRCAAFLRKALPIEPKYRDQMSNTTRFFRNYPQLLSIARTIGNNWKQGSALDVIHIGGSIGCEAISFLIVMRENQPSFKLNVLSTDVDSHSLKLARRLQYSDELFTPILGEGGNQEKLRGKWFDIREIKGKKIYRPDESLTKNIKFEFLDVTRPARERRADIIFCQNVLIHMKPRMAEVSLNNALGMLRSPAILVCAGMELDMKKIIIDAGLHPISDSIQEIHEAWCSHRFHYKNEPGKHYFELEDLDNKREDWVTRYSSIFVKK